MTFEHLIKFYARYSTKITRSLTKLLYYKGELQLIKEKYLLVFLESHKEALSFDIQFTVLHDEKHKKY